TAVRVDKATIGATCNGIDGQVAPREVFFKCDFRRGMDHEAGVAEAALALGACQGVFLATLRMQEYREVTAHLAVTGSQHRVARAAHYHPVAVLDRQAEQGITHRTAYFVDIHGSSVRREV